MFCKGWGDTELIPEAQVRTGYRRTEKDVRAVEHMSVTDIRLVTVGSSCQTFQAASSQGLAGRTQDLRTESTAGCRLVSVESLRG